MKIGIPGTNVDVIFVDVVPAIVLPVNGVPVPALHISLKFIFPIKH